MNRATRRLMHRLTRGQRCTACQGPLDEHAWNGVWVDAANRPHRHFVCNRCTVEARRAGQSGVDDLATRCALALCAPSGRA
jgi:hypothetical protein